MAYIHVHYASRLYSRIGWADHTKCCVDGTIAVSRFAPVSGIILGLKLNKTYNYVRLLTCSLKRTPISSSPFTDSTGELGRCCSKPEISRVMAYL